MKRMGWIWVTLACVLAVGAWVVLDGEHGDLADVDGVPPVSEPADAASGGVPSAASPVRGAAGTTPLRVAPEGELPARLDAPLALEIEHPDGAPAAHALVALGRGGQVLASGIADREGRLALAPFNARPPFSAWITGVTYGVHVHRVVSADDLRVVLPSGDDIAGIVTVDGAPPTKPVPIAFEVHNRPVGMVPKAVRMVLVSSIPSVVMPHVQRASPTVDGRFRISGCPPGATGRLAFPQIFELKTPAGGRRVVAPATDVHLELSSKRLVRARLVDEKGRPLEGARARLQVSGFEAGSAISDSEGLVAWMRSSVQGFTVDAELGRRRGAFSANEAPVGVIEVVLRPRRHVIVKVVDTNGEPIRGALARFVKRDDAARAVLDFLVLNNRERVDHAAPTIADGTTTVGPLISDDGWIEVTALGRNVVRVPLPPKSNDVAEVTLAPCATLEITVTGEGGGRVTKPVVHISAAKCVFSDTWHRGNALHLELGASRPSRASGGSLLRVLTEDKPHELEYPAERSVFLAGLSTDAPLEVSVRTHLGQPLWGPRSVTLGVGEARTIDAVVPGVERDVVGRVVDEAGRGVARASIVVRRPDASVETSVRADDSGRFELRAVRTDAVHLTVVHDGIANESMTIDVTSSPFLVPVHRGRDVEVAVIDEHGNAVNGMRVSARLPGEPVTSKTGGNRARSPYTLEHLPVGTVEIEVSVAGSTWTTMHDTSTSRVDVVVGPLSSLEVTWTPHNAKKLLVRLLDPNTGAHRLTRKLSTAECKAGRVVLPTVPAERHRVILHPGKLGEATIDLRALAGRRGYVRIE